MSATTENDVENVPVEPLVPTAKRAANALLDAESVLLTSHIDADGLTSAGIAATMLERANIAFETVFYKQLGEREIQEIAEEEHDVVLFTDFGSGQLEIIREYEREGAFNSVIADHHEPMNVATDYHINPLRFGVDGSTELSGAGTTYVLARCMAVETSTDFDDDVKNTNKDLSALALVGAVGDMQGGVDGVTGANKEIVSEGEEAGVIEKKKDITLYGKQTRPLPKLLEYSTDVRMPGITGSESGSINFLNNVDVELKEDDEWKCWVDLDHGEKREIVSGLIQKAIDNGVPSERINNLVGTTYELKLEEDGTALRDTSEFSTLLNATARYERQDIGLSVCLGERGEAYNEAKKLLRNHQKNISEGVSWVADNGVTHEEEIQWFDSGDEIRETIVGIIAGMSFGEGNVERDKPVIAFADKEVETEDGSVELQRKVSSRGNRNLTRKGLDLSTVMQEAAEAVGGGGGGHDIAAGATIPEDKRDEFINKVNDIVGDQIK